MPAKHRAAHGSPGKGIWPTPEAHRQAPCRPTTSTLAALTPGIYVAGRPGPRGTTASSTAGGTDTGPGLQQGRHPRRPAALESGGRQAPSGWHPRNQGHRHHRHYRQPAALTPEASRTRTPSPTRGASQTMHHRHQGRQRHRHRKPGCPGRRPGPSAKPRLKRLHALRIIPRVVDQDRLRQRVGTQGHRQFVPCLGTDRVAHGIGCMAGSSRRASAHW
jgi:hypothetical protein